MAVQEDRAHYHKIAISFAELAVNVPGKHFLDWPAKSPDMSLCKHVGITEGELLTAAHEVQALQDVPTRLGQ